MSPRSVLDILARAFPDQAFKTARFLGEGMDNRAYLVDDQFIFRFPKRAEVARHLTRELALLPHLQHLPLRVPNVQFVGTNPENRLPFAGYPLLPGRTWNETDFGQQSPEHQTKTLQLIGGFLTELHRFDVEQAIRLGVEIHHSQEDYQTDYEELQTDLYPFLAPSQRNRIDERFRAYLGNPLHFQYPNRLIHDDFSSDHILCDPATGWPQSVIDFGDVAIGDPDLDLKYVYDELGRPFVERLLSEGHYQTATPPALLMQKLAFFNFCEALMDALDELAGSPARLAPALDALLR
ncbi:phosphotransferase [Larkinella ripae]